MRAQCVVLACASLLMVGSEAARAQNPRDCNSVRFSEEVLSRFPDAQQACLDVISRDGQEFAVFKVQLDRVRGNDLFVRFNKPDGSRGPRTRVNARPDFRVLVDGEPTRVRDLAPNQQLTAYVRVDRPMMALAPATQTETWHIVPIAIVPANEGGSEASDAAAETTRLASAEDPVMPNTAGPAPLVASVGLFFIMAAVGARAIRGVRSLRRKRVARMPVA